MSPALAAASCEWFARIQCPVLTHRVRLCLRSAFWAGLDAKLVESATKGAILMCARAALRR